MQAGRSSIVFILTLAAAATFIWVTSRTMPHVVASHFNGAGVANGFMPREFYVRFMLVFVVLLPLVLVFVPGQALKSPNARINLPNKAYWLAPERRAQTLEFLNQHSARFGVMLVLLLCYTHWLVVRANAMVPPSLSSPRMIGGLVVFAAGAVIWIAVLFGRFRTVPR